MSTSAKFSSQPAGESEAQGRSERSVEPSYLRALRKVSQPSRIEGGLASHDHGSPVTVSGITKVQLVNGTTSQGVTLPAQQNKGVLIEDGVNVTSQIVVNP